MTIPADFYHAALLKVPYPVAAIDLDGTFVFVNNQFVKLLGYSQVELLTMKFHDITHHEDIGVDILELQKVTDGTISYYATQKRYVRKSGEIIDVEFTLYRYPDNGELLMFISYSDDLMRADVNIKKLNLDMEELKSKYKNVIKEVDDPNIIIKQFVRMVKSNWGVISIVGGIISSIVGWLVTYLVKG